MTKAEKQQYPEIEDLREDLNSLKNNVTELSRHVKEDGSRHAQHLKESAEMQLKDIKENGMKQYEEIEAKAKEKPMQAMLMAFAGGVLASYLIGRRG